MYNKLVTFQCSHCLQLFSYRVISHKKKTKWCHGTPDKNEVPSDNIEATQFAKEKSCLILLGLLIKRRIIFKYLI